mgnify:CR=1 FL=1
MRYRNYIYSAIILVVSLSSAHAEAPFKCASIFQIKKGAIPTNIASYISKLKDISGFRLGMNPGDALDIMKRDGYRPTTTDYNLTHEVRINNIGRRVESDNYISGITGQKITDPSDYISIAFTSPVTGNGAFDIRKTIEFQTNNRPLFNETLNAIEGKYGRHSFQKDGTYYIYYKNGMNEPEYTQEMVDNEFGYASSKREPNTQSTLSFSIPKMSGGEGLFNMKIYMIDRAYKYYDNILREQYLQEIEKTYSENCNDKTSMPPPPKL